MCFFFLHVCLRISFFFYLYTVAHIWNPALRIDTNEWFEASSSLPHISPRITKVPCYHMQIKAQSPWNLCVHTDPTQCLHFIKRSVIVSANCKLLALPWLFVTIQKLSVKEYAGINCLPQKKSLGEVAYFTGDGVTLWTLPHSFTQRTTFVFIGVISLLLQSERW